MTIETTTRVSGPFVGNGIATQLDFTFKVFADEDVQVLSRLDSTGVDTILALSVDYTVALNANQDVSPGGRVTLSVALPTGRTAYIASQVSPLQEAVFTNTGGFYPSVLNDSLDRLHALHLENREVNSRAVLTPIGETGNLSLPPVANRAGMFLYFDPIGNLIAASGTADGPLRAELTDTAGGKADTLVSHVQAGTGAVAETVQTGLRRFVYAEQYSSVQAALDSVGVTGGDVLLHKTSRLVVGNLTIPAGVRLLGQLAGRDATTDNITFSFASRGSTLLTSAGTTITLGAGASIERVLLSPSAIGAAAQSTTASFAGTAITVAGYGASVQNCVILGYAVGIASNNYSRLSICNNAIDANAAIDVQASFDTSRILNNHCWPYLTHAAFWNSGIDYASRDKTKLYRSGSGLKLTNGGDDTRVDGNLFYGFLNGMELQNVSAVNMGINWVDHPNGVNRANNIGARFRNNVSDLVLQTLMVFGTKTGVACEMNAGESISLDLCHIEATDDHAVSVTGGDVYFGNLDAQHIGNRALSIASSASKITLDAYHFESIGAAEPIAIPSGGTTDKIHIGKGYWDGAAGATLTGANALTWPVVPSADPLLLPPNGDAFLISGTTNFGNIAGGYGGRRITLEFQGVLTVNDGAVINMSGNFVTTANDVLDLIHDGSGWVQVGRSVN